MPYRVQFVGLMYFEEPGKDNPATRALLPDGRRPPDGVPPHLASISVAPDTLEGYEGWDDEEVSADDVQVEFFFAPASIVLEGADGEGPFDASRQHGRLPRLQEFCGQAKVQPGLAYADVTIRSGTLTAYRRPGSVDDGDAAVISELVVPHDEAITIRVDPKGKASPRTIRLKPGTEVAIVNTSRGLAAGASEEEHFRIYEQLCDPPVQMVAPHTRKDIPESASRHPVFLAPGPVTGTRTCSNICC